MKGLKIFLIYNFITQIIHVNLVIHLYNTYTYIIYKNKHNIIIQLNDLLLDLQCYNNKFVSYVSL